MMDLITLGRTAMVIPTPGQTEQEYLAAYLSVRGLFLAMDQNKFDIMGAVRQLDGFQSQIKLQTDSLLEKELDQWF